MGVSSSMRSRNEWRNQINHFCFAGLPSAFLSSHCPSSALPPACHQCGSFRFSTVLLLAFSGRAQLTVRRVHACPSSSLCLSFAVFVPGPLLRWFLCMVFVEDDCVKRDTMSMTYTQCIMAENKI